MKATLPMAQLGTGARAFRQFVAIFCSLLVLPGQAVVLAQTPAPAAAPAKPPAETAAKLPPEQLDSLVAPIALYPDPLLTQTLVASTYPLEIIQLKQWLEKNKGLKDKALVDAVKKQDWDPSIQGLAALPDAVALLSENIKWTSDLGNAFLAQQPDVMDAIQRMRKKALDGGNLKTNEQQKVETKVVENKTVIVVEQANPQVVYVPTYSPVVVYGAPVYPYYPMVYPPYYAAAGMAISFGVGIAMGAMWGGGWGYGCGWGGGGNNVYINHNNNFVNNSNRNNNINGGNRNQINGGNTSWNHDPSHRGGAPYGDRATASKYNGTARGDSLSTRQNSARQNQATQRGGASASTGAVSNRAGGGGASAAPRASTGAAGGDRVGNRSVPSSSSRGDGSALGSSSSGLGSSGARSSSSRGSSSVGSSRSSGGGMSRGGGGGGRRR